MSEDENKHKTLENRQARHVFYTWSAQEKATPVSITGGQGAVFFDAEGERWLDFESQVFNCNLGHGEQRVIKAIQAQASSWAWLTLLQFIQLKPL